MTKLEKMDLTELRLGLTGLDILLRLVSTDLRFVLNFDLKLVFDI